MSAIVDGAYVGFNLITRLYLLLAAYTISSYITKYVKSWNYIKYLMDCIAWSALICSAIVVLARFHLIPHSEIFYRDAYMARLKGTFHDPNVMGPYVAAGLIISVYTFYQTRSLFYIFASALMAIAVLLSGSRGAMIVVVVELAVFFALLCTGRGLSKNPLRDILIVIGMIGIMGGASWALFEFGGFKAQLAARMEAQQYDTDRFASQAYVFNKGISTPLGHGAGGAVGAYNGLSPHNVYIKVLYEGGWLGFAAFVGIFIAALWRSIAAWADQRNSPQIRLLGAAIAGTLMGHYLTSYVVDSTHWRHLFVLVGIAAGLPLESTKQPSFSLPWGRKKSGFAARSAQPTSETVA